jgi:circadian clock protein KaiC
VVDAVASSLEPTGVPNLDLILGGGLIRGTLAIIVGPPGSGKTTLAVQMAVAAARAGRQVLILTALSEPTSKLLAHLRVHDFYDPEAIGDRVNILSLQPFVGTDLASAGRDLIA